MKATNPSANVLKALGNILDESQGCSRKYLFEHDKKKYVCEIYIHRNKRSLPQNKLFFAWLTCIANELNTPKDDIAKQVDVLREFYKREFLKPKLNSLPNVGDFIVSGSTKDLDTAQFAVFLDKVKQHAQYFFNCRLPLPNERGYDHLIETYY